MSKNAASAGCGWKCGRRGDAAIDAVQPDEELLTALVRKKYARYLGDEKGKNKVVQALVRLGHSYYDALEAVEIVEEELEAEDEGED